MQERNLNVQEPTKYRNKTGVRGKWAQANIYLTDIKQIPIMCKAKS